MFLLFTVPLVVYGLITLSSFDTRNRASEEEEFVPNTCSISFPYVNPMSVPVGDTVQVQVSAYIPGEAVTLVRVFTRNGEELLNKSYDGTSEKISEVFTYTPTAQGSDTLTGTVTTDRGAKPCVLEGAASVLAVTTNLAPEFTTQPTAAKPSNAIKVNDSYEYTLQVEDAESDTINYDFSFTPDADWLKHTVIEDGGAGKLTIKFTGVPDKPASYLANMFVHDGYNAHLRAQTWVISVEQDENDVPKVVVFEPASESSITQGDTVKVSWEGTDLNKIVKYELYISTNPGNSNTWLPIDRDISPKVGTYLFDTSNMLPGTYQFVVRAVDNGSPEAIGTGVSPRVSIDAPIPPDEDDPDDGVILQDPQVINISPSNNGQVKNRNALITATLIAGTDATIDQESIKFVLDDKDLTNGLKMNELSDSEITITHTPSQQYKAGLHKVTVSFTDSNEESVEKSWVFNVVVDEAEDEDTYNIYGFEIPKRTAWILGGGIGILILALIVPWLLYLAWRGSGDNYEDLYKQTTPIVPDTSPEPEPEYPTFVQNEPEPPAPPPPPPPAPVVQAPEPKDEQIDTSINPVIPEPEQTDTTAQQLQDLAAQLEQSSGEQIPTAPSPQPPDPPKQA
jgi:hypothetical protein